MIGNNLRWNRERSTLAFGVSDAYIHQFHVFGFGCLIIMENGKKVVSPFNGCFFKKSKLRTHGACTIKFTHTHIH